MRKRRMLAAAAAGIMMAAAILGGCSGKSTAGSQTKGEAAESVSAGADQTTAGQSGEDKEAKDQKAEAAAGNGQAGSQADTQWPQKAVSLIVPAGAGGGTDTNARLLAKYLTEELGQPVTVVNIAGSSGAMGLKEARNAANDGYTFVYFNEDTVTNQKLGVMDFGYQDLDMISNVFQIDMFLVGNSDIPDVAALKKTAQEKPGEVIFGGESSAFISMLPYIINEKLGIELKIVDGGQMSERLPLMVGKQIDLTFAPLATIKDYLETGDLNAVALISDERSDKAPDIATSVEQGLDIVYNRFQCVMGPQGMDEAVKTKMAQAIQTVCDNPQFIGEAGNNGVAVSYTDAEGLTKLMEDYSVALEEYMQYLPGK